MLKDKIENKLNEYVKGTDLFFVDVKITPQQKIMLFVDGKQNITIDKCVEISRMLEAYLEEENLVGEKYTLEVSSPGMGEPLKVLQQYHKSIESLVEVLKKDGNKYKGILKKVDNDGIQLESQTIKNKKVVATNLLDIPFDDIKTTKKLITFK
ncbi:MAG: ribosome maturation factor [Chitinophagales bacterium]